MSWSSLALLILALPAFAALTPDEEKKYDELEGAAFFARLVEDGKHAEALLQFPKLRQSERHRALNLKLKGDAHGGLKQWGEAAQSYEAALRADDNHLAARAGAGRAHAQLQRHAPCAAHFRIVPRGELSTSDQLLFLVCLEKSGASDELLGYALDQGARPLDGEVFVARWDVLHRHGLHQAAAEQLTVFLKTCHPPLFYVSLAEAMEKQGASAFLPLEHGHACHPGDQDVKLLLVQALFRAQQLQSVAPFFEALAWGDPAYYHHAAEFWAAARRPVTAHYFRVRTPDSSAALKARAGEWVNAGRFAHVAALAEWTGAQGWDDPLRYAAGFANFKYKRIGAMLPLLQGLRSPSLQKQAGQLLEMGSKCRELGWQCRP